MVEDDPTVRQLICAVLAGEGFEVDAAVDGQQALEKAAERRPTLLVLDLTLPLLSGPEFIATLGSQDGAPIPILVISGDGHAPVSPVNWARSPTVSSQMRMSPSGQCEGRFPQLRM